MTGHFYAKSVQLIWKLGVRRFHLPIPDPWMICGDLTRMRSYQDIKIVAPIMAASPRYQVCHFRSHYDDVIMGAMASQITSLTTVYSTVISGADQRKHQSSVSLAFVWGIHRGPVNSPHKWPVTRKMFPFDDVIMDSVQGYRTSMRNWPSTWSHNSPEQYVK